ncbi:uncharacterized protein [Ptychodera flava]|uniref:uncharacterized protein n=1 Tax=Ptychodera flava TaxID=63121 RepID=UPI00396A194F
MLVEELEKAGDRAIPLFVILTHCDEDDGDSRVYHDVLQKGIAASRVFRISNNHQDKYEAQHPTAHHHTLSALWKILSVSKIFKEDGRVPLENEGRGPSRSTSGFHARMSHCVIS